MIRANKQRIKRRAMQSMPDYIKAPKSQPNWSDKLGAIGGALMDYDGTFGSGNMDRALTRTQQRIRLQDEEKQAELDRKRRQIVLDGMQLTPQQRALMELGGDDRAFIYGMGRDGVADARDERNYGRGVYESDRSYNAGRSDRAEDLAYRDDRARTADAFKERGLDLQERGVTLQESVAAAKAAEEAGPDIKGESALRKEFLSQNKGFQEIQRAFGRILETDPTNAAGQMSLIFQYMKMMDPGSTVREGEFANAQNTTGIPGQVLNAYNRARAGEFLNPTQVGEFQRQAEKLYGAAAQDFELSFDQYRSTADQYRYDQGRTIPDLRNPDYGTVTTASPFPGAPPIGTVEDGHEYIGGDPSNPASWRSTG